MKIALSGFEGVGKSYLTEKMNEHGFFKIRESARSLIALKNLGFEDRNMLSMTALTNNLKAIDMVCDNKIEKAVFDRSILDDFIYLDLYQGQNLSKKLFQKIIDNCNSKNETTTIYDKIVLLTHSKDDDYINNSVLTDKDRIYGQNIKQYKQASEIWEYKFKEFYHLFKGLAKEIQTVQCYPENNDPIKDIFDN
jgi:predicted ATPase